MSFETRSRAFVSPPQNKVRIGSRVPEGNQEWLKRHGIVTDQGLSYIRSSVAMIVPKPHFKQFVAVIAAIFVCLLLWAGLRQQQHVVNEIKSARFHAQSLMGANHHLRENSEQLSSINAVQQSEINRMGSQLRDMSHQFHYQVTGLEKGVAMADALQRAFENQLNRMGDHYDREVESLRKQIGEKDQVIFSLETSLQSMDGLIVTANSLSDPKNVSGGAIEAINIDYQFVLVGLGEIKGARVGQMAEFYHQGDLIGYGQVEKVYPDVSGVKVFSLDVLNQLEKSDRVFLKS